MKNLFYPFWKKKRSGKYKKPSINSRVYSLGKEVSHLRGKLYDTNEKIRLLAKANNQHWDEGFISNIKPWEPR